MNFAIPSNYLRDLLGKVGDAKPLAEAKPSKSERSLLSDLGGRSSESITVTQFVWESFLLMEDFDPMVDGSYSFSLKNQLPEAVRNVYLLVCFYDAEGSPLEVNEVRYSGTIPPGLAKRVSARTSSSVHKLTTPKPSATPSTKLEFRILDFEVAK